MRALAAGIVAALALAGSAQAGALVVALPRGVVPPPVPPAPPLVVGPFASGQPIECAGRDVLVRADGVAVELRGGCRSLAIDGGRVTVTAELLPGAPLWIGSAGVVVNYALVGRGPPPVVRLTTPGLHATHVERLGQAALTLPVSSVIATTPYR